MYTLDLVLREGLSMQVQFKLKNVKEVIFKNRDDYIRQREQLEQVPKIETVWFVEVKSSVY